MPAWSLKSAGGGGGASPDWFLNQLAVARATLPDADFDTIIGSDFANTIEVELVDVLGVADVNTADIASGGIITASAGNNDTADNSGRIQLTGAGAHVADLSLSPWFMAALFKITQPLDAPTISGTRADAVNLWADDNNWVAIGMFGNASGGSNTRWVGSVNKDAGITTTLGPLLDGVESPVWHLAQAWIDPDGALHFAIDGAEFLSTIAAANVPSLPAMLSAKFQRNSVGDDLLINYDKFAVIVRSPTVGDP